MNTLQWVSTARALIILFGGVAVGLGWATQNDIDAISNPEVLTPIIGGVAAAVAIFYGWRARRAPALADAALKVDPQGTIDKAAALAPTAVVQAAATVKGVETIVAEPHIASAVPSDKVIAREF